MYFFRHTNESYSKFNTDAWQLCHELNYDGTDVIMNKETSSVFKEKAFKSSLDEKNIDTIVVAGLVSNGCVQAACTDGNKLGYHVILIGDAHSTFTKDPDKVILQWNQNLQKEGIVVMTTEEFINN